MKKSGYVIIGLGLLLVILGIVFVKKNDDSNIINSDSLLEMGERKYLQFLWLVDGAFNDSRYNETFKVNGKEIKKEDKILECNYKNDKKTCIANHFEEAFQDTFVSSINYDKVYSDGLSFKWYENKDGVFKFTNMNVCNASRMNVEQTLKIEEESKDKVVYSVSFTDKIASGTYSGIHNLAKRFVLVKEDGKWKVSEAYYHDPCYMDYYIS